MDHKNSQSASYAAAGVDITAGYKAVELMKKHVARTRNEGCLDDVGGFGGCFGLPIAGMEEPVLVSGTDGVGTKLKIAMLLDKHDTIGIDCVAMCVNDVICCGAKPLFFLDYIACGKNVPERIAQRRKLIKLAAAYPNFGMPLFQLYKSCKSALGMSFSRLSLARSLSK